MKQRHDRLLNAAVTGMVLIPSYFYLDESGFYKVLFIAMLIELTYIRYALYNPTESE